MTGSGQLRRVSRALATLNGVLAVVLFAALTVVVALQVFTRFVLQAPLIWSEELARFLFFWVVMLGSALSVRHRRHFVIDVTMGRTGAKGWGQGGEGRRRFLVDRIPDLCILAFSVLLLVQGLGYVEVGLLRVAPNSQVNMALVYAAIPVFAGLSIVYSLAHLIVDSLAHFEAPAVGGGGMGDQEGGTD